MSERTRLDFWEHLPAIMSHMREGGVLCTVVDESGRENVLTLGWGQAGPGYHGNPIITIAITPLRFSWRFLEEVPDFVIAVPSESMERAAEVCGTLSGRDLDKFDAAGLTRTPSAHVRAPSIAECPVNLECRTYARVDPPHMLLTPEHRERPVKDQHTIYFAEVLGAYAYR
jgi:flavin reductase (DIM6/NTAB) family NADH-FMN oxidoreductase RutF